MSWKESEVPPRHARIDPRIHDESRLSKAPYRKSSIFGTSSWIARAKPGNDRMLAMNPFDAAVYALTILAIVAGYRSGLLRSLATIFGYVVAMPLAVAAAPYLIPILNNQFHLSPAQNWLALFGVFLLTGMVLSALLRLAVSEFAGPQVNLPDRAAGAVLGAVRIVLLAVLMVLIFDRIIPAGREPAFLADSRLRPILSMAGQQGLKSLPPDVVEYIDRLKKERGI